MNRIRFAVACAAMAGGTLPFVTGEARADAERLDEIVVSASKVEQPLRQIGSSVSVLTEEELESRGIVYVQDALRDLPGVSIGSSGRPGSPTSIFLRGEEGYRTLVLIDGIEVSDPSGTQNLPSIQNILAYEVGRIEVIKGPQSLLYGADAMGGVINIITKRPGEGFNASLRVDGGSYKTLAEAVSLYWGGERLDVALHASHYETEGFSAKTDPSLSDDDGHENTTLHGTIGLDIAPNVQFDGVVRYSDSDNEFDGFAASIFGPADPYRNLLTEEFAGRGVLSAQVFDGLVDASLAYAYFDINRTDQTNRQPTVVLGTPSSQFDGVRHKAEALADLQVTEEHGILFGADFEEEKVDLDASRKSSGSWGMFAEWRSAFWDRLFLTAGLRYDDNRDFGSHETYRISGAYLLPAQGGTIGETKLRASVGTGFRAPSFYELHDPTYGNSDLEEETAFGWDAGVDIPVAGARAALSVTYFRQEVEDEIRFDNVGFTSYFQADGTTKSEGIETAIRLEPLPGLTAELAYTYLDAKVNSPDAEDGLPRLRRPRHTGSVNLNYRFWGDRAELHAGFNGVADRQDGFSASRIQLDDYGIFEIGGSVELVEGVRLRGHVTNLFNDNYEEFNGFYAPDAAGLVGLQMKL